MLANLQTSVWDSKLSRENYYGTNTAMTAGDCQHPFGTFKTDLPLVKTTKKIFHCCYRTEICRPYNSKIFPRKILSHGTKRWMLKKNLSEKVTALFHMLGIGCYEFSWGLRGLGGRVNSFNLI